MQEEKYNGRDRTYSAWHRRMSTQRFVGMELAQTLGMIDLDASLYVEYDDNTKEPLALIETALDVGQDRKTATVTKNLARRCTSIYTPAFILLYTKSNKVNPADPLYLDIASFRAKRIWKEPETRWYHYTPSQWAKWLVGLRQFTAASLDNWLEATGKQCFDDLNRWVKSP
jgi:hypothetical protein